MGRRFKLDRIKDVRPDRKYYFGLWEGAGTGKYWKRRMQKARRQAWKQRGVEGTPVNKYEDLCNYKGW